LLTIILLLLKILREEHIQRKIDGMIAEAKAKKAKGDTKGTYREVCMHAIRAYLTINHSLTLSFHTCLFSIKIKGALFAMKRKKLYESEYDKIQNVKMTLETQVINLESAAQNAETFRAMEAGSKTMQKIRVEVGVDKADDIMEAIREEMEMAQEINQAIAQPVDANLADEDELMEELNLLEAQDMEAELLAPPITGLKLPTVPDSKLPQLAKKEEDDLKQLEAELAAL
jgi:charged multivesicular body protein 4